MFLHHLQIKGYRGFVDLTVSFEPDCTVIIGENNAGKTNVIDALYSSLRVNRTVKQGAFDLNDYHLAGREAMAGDAGPIELTVVFRERVQDEWPPEIIQALRQVPTLNINTGLTSVNIQVKSSAPAAGKEEEYEWNFVDDEGAARAAKSFDVLSNIQKLRPFFRLDTMRDAVREFNRRSTFFGPFVSDPNFDDELRDDLLGSLSDINAKVLGAHEAFNVLHESLQNGAKIVRSDMDDAVTIEAVPSRLSDLLANTQVSYQGATGAVLPLDRHGSGTQSLSVMSLFQAYVTAKLANQMDPLSEPILAIEEPESHLHPNGVRSLWALITSLQGQKVITSHSGDLLSEVPLRCIRRLSTVDGVALCYCIDEGKFDRADIRHINYQIRATRGELFFARTWLLVEGRCESSVLPEIGKCLAIDLVNKGVRVVEYQQCGGPVPYVRLAEQLGISWHVLADGDHSGQTNVRKVREYLDGRNEDGRITQLDSANYESFMCKHGFTGVYRPHVPAEKAASITANEGTDEYFVQVAKAVVDRKKERLALEVAAIMQDDPERVPALLRDMLRAF